ncbi:uncharacterized protein V6R79_001730 [Siganus canaliculatus]
MVSDRDDNNQKWYWITIESREPISVWKPTKHSAGPAVRPRRCSFICWKLIRSLSLNLKLENNWPFVSSISQLVQKNVFFQLTTTLENLMQCEMFGLQAMTLFSCASFEPPASAVLPAQLPASAEPSAAAELSAEPPAAAELSAEPPAAAELSAEPPASAELSAEPPASAELSAEPSASAELPGLSSWMVVLAVVVPLLCAVSLPVVVHLHLLRVCTSRTLELIKGQNSSGLNVELLDV